MKFANIFENLNQLKDKIDALSSDKKIVYTYGAWDLLHPGHVIFLRRARDLGDFLIAGVVADSPIRKLKGVDRPIQLQNERMVTTSSVRFVDAVVGQSEYDPSNELRILSRIDILTKGDDWDYIPGTETIEQLGGKLVKFSYTDGFSTSKLVSKLDS